VGNIKNSRETRRNFADSTVLFLNLYHELFAFPHLNCTLVFSSHGNHGSLFTFLVTMSALEGMLATVYLVSVRFCFRNELMHRVEVSLVKLKRSPRQLRA
jgi:uncharacterized membrane protein YesL